MDEEKSKWDGGLLIKPVFQFNEEAIYWKDKLSKIMEDTQTKCFESMNSPVRGAVDANLAPFWAH